MAASVSVRVRESVNHVAGVCSGGCVAGVCNGGVWRGCVAGVCSGGV